MPAPFRTLVPRPPGLAALALWLLHLPGAAQPISGTGELAAATELTDRGLLVGTDRPVLQAAYTLVLDRRWTLGLTSSLPLGEPGQRRLLASLGRYDTLSDDWQLDTQLAYYGYPGDAHAGEFNRWELQVGGSYRDVFNLGLTALHYPAWPGQRGGLQWALDLGLRWPLAGGWSATASLGRADLPPLPRLRYTYAGLGLAWQAGDWRLELNRLGSDARARRIMGPLAERRWSASVSWAF